MARAYGPYEHRQIGMQTAYGGGLVFREAADVCPACLAGPWRLVDIRRRDYVRHADEV